MLKIYRGYLRRDRSPLICCSKLLKLLILIRVIMTETGVSIGFKYMKKMNLLVGHMKKEYSSRDRGIDRMKGAGFIIRLMIKKILLTRIFNIKPDLFVYLY